MRSMEGKKLENQLVLSYLALRNFIGFVGILLPIILVFTTKKTMVDKMIEPSISDYYYTSNGDFLVVLLSVLGVFLFTYHGYNWKENLLTSIAAIASIGVAFSPTATCFANSYSIHELKKTVPTILGIEHHFIFAAIFFICLALMSLIYFTETDLESINSNPQKKKRNRVYKITGWLIVLCIVLLLIYFIFNFENKEELKNIPMVFILEVVAIEAFGIAWITKGQTLWPDGKHYIQKGLELFKAKIKNI